MDAEITRLAEKAWEELSGWLGKTTLANNVVMAINALHEQGKGSNVEAIAADVSMDGYHYTRAQLAAMNDPVTAIHRRGAAFTFDADGFCKLVERLHQPVSKGTIIYAPSFEHAIMDPVEDSIAILPTTKIVVFEGNYVCLDREPWRSAAQLMTELWFVEVDREVARKRLVKRHVASGICQDEQAARERIRTTDFLNADDILENRLPVKERVKCC
ncbi:hypothetical protein G7Z17_g1845 [Cylindrodendrum hubeiense]|uniref:Phosphoribulokinase/uridine kinase domain-containing protein n=1 Tax=Cylindrodendrum hubeiense TaxID=595255 RepID=A0A9P5HIU5_9HYPO|nr:hypothetical protein G7Z17_g1845 [Cylindrodendrum hubeiense]